MRVYYKTQVYPVPAGFVGCFPVHRHAALDGRTTPCCAGMRYHLGKIIKLEEQTSAEPKTLLCFDRTSSDDYGDPQHDLVPIAFCPWCGEKIEMIQESMVRMVEQVREVTETRTIKEFVEDGPA